MNTPRLTVPPSLVSRSATDARPRTLTATPRPATPPRGIAAGPRGQASAQAMRRYEITTLGRDGTVHGMTRPAPASPVFEQAFAALARGTLIATTAGPVAVEDLMPGDFLQTREDGPQQLIWIGMMTLFPAAVPGQGGCPGPIRVPADSFGPGRPANDVVLGPYARLLQRRPASVPGRDDGWSYVPLADLVDGQSAIRLSPATPVQVYHLGLRRHATICAGGLDVESFHPGSAADTMSDDMRDLYLALFPHVRQMTSFGPAAHPQRPYPGRDSRSDAA